MRKKRGVDKDDLFKITEHLPIVGGTADPFMATVLGCFVVVVTALATLDPDLLFDDDAEARTHILQFAGGLLVVGAFYFGAVTLRTNRAGEHANRLLTTLGLLDATHATAVRVAAIQLLDGMSLVNPNLPKDTTSKAVADGQREAIALALDAIARDTNDACHETARDVLRTNALLSAILERRARTDAA